MFKGHEKVINEKMTIAIQKANRIVLLQQETKFWFDESSSLASAGYIGEASDAYDTYLILSNELKELLFG